MTKNTSPRGLPARRRPFNAPEKVPVQTILLTSVKWSKKLTTREGLTL